MKETGASRDRSKDKALFIDFSLADPPPWLPGHKERKDYVRIRFWMQGRRKEEFFGRATPETIQAAKRKLAEYRLKQTAGTLQLEMAEKPVTVAQPCDRYLQYMERVTPASLISW